MSHYYNPFRAWYQRRLYRPVSWVSNRMWVPERVYAWQYKASGAGRRPTRKEADYIHSLAASLPLVPRSRYEHGRFVPPEKHTDE